MMKPQQTVPGTVLQFVKSLIVYDHPTTFRQTIKEDRGFLGLLLAAGTVLFILVSIAWPLELGRDWYRYFIYFFTFPDGLNFYTMPGTPFILGSIAKGGLSAFFFTALIAYLISLFGVYYVGRIFSRNLARIAAIFALAHIQFVLLNFYVNSDFLFALFNTILAIVLVRFYQERTLVAYAAIGLACLMVVMIRPIGQIYILLAVLPIVCFGFSKKNLILAGMIVTVFVGGLVLVAAFNYQMLGKFIVTEGGEGLLFRQGYLFSRVISPDNGPASKQLEKMVDKLVTDPIYTENGVTTEMFFNSPNKLFYYEIVDTYPDKFKFLNEVTVEGIRADPGKFFQAVYTNIIFQFTSAFDPGAVPIPQVPKETKQTVKAVKKSECKYASCLPIPSTAMSKKNNQLQEHFSPEEQLKHAELKKYLLNIEAIFPKSPGNYMVGELFRSLIYKYPTIFSFFIATPLLLFGIKRQEVRLLVLFLIPSTAVPVISSFVDPLPQYRLPHDLYLVVAGLAGIGIMLKLAVEPLLKKNLPIES